MKHVVGVVSHLLHQQSLIRILLNQSLLSHHSEPVLQISQAFLDYLALSSHVLNWTRHRVLDTPLSLLIF